MDELKYIKYEGFTALVCSYIGGREGLLFVSFAGPLGVVRAIAAALVSSDTRKSNSGIEIMGAPVHLLKGTPYKMLPQKASYRSPSGVITRVNVVAEAVTATNLRPKDMLRIMTRAENPQSQAPEDFAMRLRYATGLAIREEWTDWLWERAWRHNSWWDVDDKWRKVSRKLIAEPKYYGEYKMYFVEISRYAWLHLIRAHNNLILKIKDTDDPNILSVTGRPEGWHMRRIKDMWTLYYNNEVQTYEYTDGKAKKIAPIAAADIKAALRLACIEGEIELELD